MEYEMYIDAYNGEVIRVEEERDDDFSVTKILDGLEAWRMYQSKDWDIILLDVILFFIF